MFFFKFGLIFCFHAVSRNETLGGVSSVHSTYVQYVVDGSPDSTLYARQLTGKCISNY